jgi:AmmeMemoRadiSam system protein B
MVPHPPLIIPEVGHGQENVIQDTIHSYKKAARFITEKQPDTIVIISPHSIMYSDYFHISPGASAKGSFARFNADEVKFQVEYDTEFVSELCRAADDTGLSAGIHGEKEKELDHATMVPLYFIRQAYGGEIKAKIIRIGLSGLPYSDHYRLGMLINKTAEKLNRKIAVVASGDLSHRLKQDGPYGYKAEGPVYDEKIMNVMEHGTFGELFDFDESFCDNAGECGQRSFIIMAGCFDGENVKAEKLSYEGPFGVGYGVCTFTPCGQNNECCFLNKYLEGQKKKLFKLKQNEDE